MFMTPRDPDPRHVESTSGRRMDRHPIGLGPRLAVLDDLRDLFDVSDRDMLAQLSGSDRP